MNDQLAAALFWLILLTPIGIFARQARQVRSGLQRKVKATVLFFAYSMLPLLAFGGGFLLLAGVEELTKRAIISEGYARMLLPLAAINTAEVLLLTVVFGIVSALMRVTGSTPPKPD